MPIEVTLGSAAANYGVNLANTTSANAGIRFNTHHQFRNNWLWDCRSRIWYVNGGIMSILVTTNVGVQNVNFTGTAHAPRWNGGEMLLQQENIYGDLVFGGSQSYTGAGGTLTKSGAGRVIFNSWLPNQGPSRVQQGTLLVNGQTSPNSAWTVYSGATLGGSGSIRGTLNVLPGGTLWPGNGTNGIGVLTLSNATTLVAGTYMKFYTPGSAHDQHPGVDGLHQPHRQRRGQRFDFVRPGGGGPVSAVPDPYRAVCPHICQLQSHPPATRFRAI